MWPLTWDDMHTLWILDQCGSVREAARQLAVHPSTVSRRLDAAEERFGHRLVDRAAHPVRFETAAHPLLEAARQMSSVHLRAMRHATNDAETMAGGLTVGLPDASVAHLLMPVLASFFRAHPQIEATLPTYATTLDVAHMAADLARGTLDVMVAVAQEPPPHLVGRRLPTPEYGWFGVPEHGWDAPRIGWRYRADDLAYLPTSADADQVVHRVDSMLTMFEAAQAGLGIAWLPAALAARSSLLERVPNSATRPGVPVWILTLPQRRTVTRVKALMSWVADRVG